LTCYVLSLFSLLYIVFIVMLVQVACTVYTDLNNSVSEKSGNKAWSNYVLIRAVG